MRLVVTGGGTGGHAYPALEVARLGRERGAELLYLGSLRGQEGDACRQRGIPFEGFPAQPLYSLRSVRGWKSAISLLRSVGMAKRALRAAKPDVVFSTGGYSAAPVMAAARSLGVPYCIHECNSIPGRSNLMFAKKASAFSCTFRVTESHAKDIAVVRTGQPIRKELRDVVDDRIEGPPTVLVVGGSQGSAFLNGAVPAASAFFGPDVRVIHAAGKGNYSKMSGEAKVGPNYRIEPYLETADMVAAYRSATVAIARSGGGLSEFAMFGLPSVLIPLPSSADDHQLYNAREFEDMQAATVMWQPDDTRTPAPPATAEALAAAVNAWVEDPQRRAVASHNLKEWDVPDATERIYDLVERAAKHLSPTA